MLDIEYQYYKDHKNEFDAKYNNKFIIIIGNNIIGIYDDIDTALKETLQKHKAGTFLLQKCGVNQKMKFYSRVSFANAT